MNAMFRARRGAAIGLTSSLVWATLAASPTPAMAQTAAAGTVAIDVQVVDRDGNPISGITADKFNVEVNGRRRRVVEARQIEGGGPGTEALEGRRVYFVVVDASTFGAGATSDALDIVSTFVRTLPEGALVGLVTLPGGPGVELTTDHEAVLSAIGGISGQRQAFLGGQFGLGPSDVIEYLSSPDPTEIARGFCGAELSEDNACPQLLEQEANTTVNVLETQARASLGMLADFTSRLSQIPGRKVVVLASAGVAVSSRSGARPDVGNLPTELAEAITGSDIALYTLLLDRLPDDAAQGRPSSNPGRDRDVMGRWLDQFSTSMGGALIRVQAGQDLDAYDRISRETVSFYQLVVEVPESDLANEPQRLRVRVDARGSTVRARTMVKGR